ncbi:MAG: hypothetical protein RLZZ308_114 [Candidatus Parcubacteria bacterium]|jgi:hypothetical protein
MKLVVESLSLIVRRSDSRAIIIVTTLLLFLLLLISQNGQAAIGLLSLSSLPLTTKMALFVTTLFDITNTFTTGTLVLVVLGSFLSGINMSLAYTYMKIRGGAILKSGMYSGLGLILAFLGIGCAACGTALLSLMLGFLGFSTMLSFFPYQGQEIGYIGLIFLCIATYTLAKKLSAPNVC